MDLSNASDESLLSLALEGNGEAFSALFRRRQHGIFRFSLHMCGNMPIAEEVTQEVFLAVIRGTAVFNPARGSVASFLLGVARHLARRGFSRERVPGFQTSRAGQDQELALDGIASGDNLIESLQQKENIRAVRRAILSLPPNYREAVVLCEIEELSYEEAADVAGCAIGTIRSRLHRARAILAAKLAPLSHQSAEHNLPRRESPETEVPKREVSKLESRLAERRVVA